VTAISDEYGVLGGTNGVLGPPTSGVGELTTPDGIGRYVQYRAGSIYWSPATGAHEVHGAILEKWAALGWERSALGYPVSDEEPVGDELGRMSHFQNGSIFWNPVLGAHEVRGAINARYNADGGPARSGYGYPTSDEQPVLRGRVSHFERADVFWDGRDAYVVYPPPAPETRPAEQVGRWEVAPYTSGVIGVHAALLHTNQVLFWSFRPPDDPNADPNPPLYAVSTVLDLATGSLLHPSYEGPLPDLDNIFCGGHAFLPDGRLIVVGGDREGYVRPTPVKAIHEFVPGGPGGGHWHYLGDMRQGRWYPTAATLPDGRVLIAGGHSRNDIAPREANNIFEVYDRGVGLTPQTGALEVLHLEAALYPFVVVLPDRTALVHGNTTSQFLDLATMTPLPGTLEAADRPDRASRTYGVEGACVLLPMRPSTQPPYRATVMMIGGGGPGAGLAEPATASAELLDTAAAPKRWRLTTSMAHRRVMPDAVLLPDGTVFVCNGSDQGQSDNSAAPVFEAEIYHPDTETWDRAATATVPRLYHATALLLPDGRVMTAGTDGSWNQPPYNVGELRIELYSPPYLFRGRRPTLAGAPDGVQYGQNFTIDTLDAPIVDEVVLVRCGSVTHSSNFNQRLVELIVTARTDHTVTATAPPDGYVAAPGIYLLFVLAAGVPSVGRFIQVAPSAHDGFVALDPAQTEHLGLLNRFRTTVPPVLNTEHWTSWPPPPPPPPPPDLDLDHPQDQPHLLPRDVPLGKD
jgi:hypothetical protein